MGSILPEDVPCSKGWIPYCLEICSRSPRARDYLQALKTAIEALGPGYHGLEQALDAHLVSRVVVGTGALEKRRKIREHLKANWYDDASPEAFFPQQQAGRIIAEGLLKTLDVALQPAQPLPITAWWLPGFPAVKTLTMLDDGHVTHLIMTPRPPAAAARLRPASMRSIIRGEAEAWDGAVRVRDLGTDRASSERKAS